MFRKLYLDLQDVFLHETLMPFIKGFINAFYKNTNMNQLA